MKQVTKEEFYRIIREKKLNVYVSAIGDYPYTSVFKFPSGLLWGKIVRNPDEERKHYPFYTEQYLIND